MKKALILGLLAVAIVGGIAVASTTTTPAKGWFMAGMAPDDYDSGLDRDIKHSGSSSAYIRSKDNPKDFSTLMQVIAPENFAGKRVRFSAWVKSDKVSEWAGLWMRIDKGTESIAFDNMQDRAIKGTTEWREYEVILDVAPDATGIFFGVLTSGTGTVWIDDAKLEIAPATAKPTGMSDGKAYPATPQNLSFEE
jgi:hypothetical protein